MTLSNLSYISKIPDLLGYMVIQDKALFKSDGDLLNAEKFALTVQKIVGIGGTEALVKDENFTEITIHYPTFFYSIVNSGGSIIVVKRLANSNFNTVDPSFFPPDEQ